MDLLLARRRALRNNATDAEVALWTHLRRKQFMGLRFRRQHPCGPYVLDFYCPSRRLAVELDGGQHFQEEAIRYDRRRTDYLRHRGIRVIRFPTDLPLRDPSTLLEALLVALQPDSPP